LELLSQTSSSVAVLEWLKYSAARAISCSFSTRKITVSRSSAKFTEASSSNPTKRNRPRLTNSKTSPILKKSMPKAIHRKIYSTLLCLHVRNQPRGSEKDRIIVAGQS
jgi:hypothetical protein